MQPAVFWASTPQEVGALLSAIAEKREQEQRAAVLRAGLIASAVHNAHRADSQGRRYFHTGPAMQPGDYLRRDVRYLEPEEFAAELRAWARSHNQQVAKA